MQKHEDQWLSEVLGKPAFRVVCGNDNLDLPKSCFAFSKTSTHDVASGENLTKLGFFLVDTNVTYLYEGNAPEHQARVFVREARTEDENAVRAIASNIFSLTRFHVDPYIDINVAHKMKADWAGNYFSGKRGDLMLVAEMDGKVVGFNQILLREDMAIIDLIGVAKEAQGQGVGRALIGYMQKTYTKILVGTQLSNNNSIALYEKMGFRYNDAHYVFHYHGDNR